MDMNQEASVVGELEGVHSPITGQHILKFEVQIYKARDGEYVVDFQVIISARDLSLFGLHLKFSLCMSRSP